MSELVVVGVVGILGIGAIAVGAYVVQQVRAAPLLRQQIEAVEQDIEAARDGLLRVEQLRSQLDSQLDEQHRQRAAPLTTDSLSETPVETQGMSVRVGNGPWLAIRTADVAVGHVYSIILDSDGRYRVLPSDHGLAPILPTSTRVAIVRVPPGAANLNRKNVLLLTAQ